MVKKTLYMIAVLGLMMAFASPVSAQEGNPPDLSLTTEFPGRTLSPDDVSTIDLTLEGNRTETVALRLEGLPEGWKSSYQGRGATVFSALVEPGSETDLTLRIETPGDLKSGTYQITAVAEGETVSAELPLEFVVVKEKPQQISLDVDLQTVSGSPSSIFRYNATLENESNREISVNLSSDSPAGFTTTFSIGGENVTGLQLGPNQSRQFIVAVKPASGVASGTYPITITAQGGDDRSSLELKAEVTGQADLNLTTPDGRLSREAQIGKETNLTLVVENTGTVAARDIQLTANTPTGWIVAFDMEKISEIQAGQQAEVTASIQPADKAVAGDYQLTIRANGDEGQSTSQQFRITVVTSTLWGITGVGLIAVAVLVVVLAVFRFGRR